MSIYGPLRKIAKKRRISLLYWFKVYKVSIHQ